MGDLGLIFGLGRSFGGEHGHPLQYSCLEKTHGQWNLVGYSPWSHKELDMLARDILLQKFKHWSTGLNINTEGNFGLLLYLLKDLELTVHTYTTLRKQNNKKLKPC